MVSGCGVYLVFHQTPVVRAQARSPGVIIEPTPGILRTAGESGYITLCYGVLECHNFLLFCHPGPACPFTRQFLWRTYLIGGSRDPGEGWRWFLLV